MDAKEEIYPFIEKTIKEKTYCTKNDLSDLIISKFNSTNDISEERARDIIERWFKATDKDTFDKLKATKFKKAFDLDILVNGNDMIYYYKRAFDENQILYAKNLIKKNRFDLAQNIILHRTLNLNEFYDIFDLLNQKYPIDFIKLVLDTLSDNIKEQDSKSIFPAITEGKKEKLITKIDLFYTTNYAPLSIYLEECPDIKEYNKIDEQVNKLRGECSNTFYYDTSKNTPSQNKLLKLEEERAKLSTKIYEYNKEIELKKSIRGKLIEIIALLKDKHKLYDYFTSDIDQYKIYINKASRSNEELEDMCKLKTVHPPIALEFTSGDKDVDRLYRKKSELYYQSNQLYTLICACYSKGVVNLWFSNSSEFNKGKLICDYEKYADIQKIINVVCR
ncbi:MAG TPA: hypothetical protein PLK55_01565 [archaeon]|nr:hypothetical protein [archaeon]